MTYCFQQYFCINLRVIILSIRTIMLLLMVVFTLAACDDKRSFYLSPVANSPLEINKLKERWYFCENCLNDSSCSNDNVKQCESITIPDRQEALANAVSSANTEAVSFLVDVTKVDVNGVSGPYKETPLMIAAYYGTKEHQKISEFLLLHGADINATRKSQTTGTALLTAIWKNNIDFATFLISKGASPSLTTNGEVEGSVCSIAIGRGRSNFISIIPGCCSLIKHDSDLGKLSECPKIDN